MSIEVPNKSNLKFEKWIQALIGAFVDMLRPKILFLTLLPAFLAFIFWSSMFIANFDVWVNSFVAVMLDIPPTFRFGMESLEVMTWVVRVLVFIMFFPIAYFTAVLMISVFLFPVILRYVHKKHYPTLKSQNKLSIFSSLKKSISIIFKLIMLALLTSPMLLIPVLNVFYPLFLTAYLNKNFFAMDVLGEFLSNKEFKEFEERENFNLWALAILTSVFAYMPVIQLFAPLLSALVFIRYCLSSIQEQT